MAKDFAFRRGNDATDTVEDIRKKYPNYGYRRVSALSKTQGTPVSHRQARQALIDLKDSEDRRASRLEKGEWWK